MMSERAHSLFHKKDRIIVLPMMIQDFIARLSDQIWLLTPKIFNGLLIMLLFWVGGFVAEYVLRTISRRYTTQQDFLALMARVSRIGLFILGTISALGTMGLNITALVASLGLTGFALGFALKDALSNVLAGMLVMIYKPFKIGSTIKVIGYEGRVQRIDLRYTTIVCENRRILIPNSSLFNNPIEIST